MAKVLGFIIGLIVAVAGPAAFGVFAPGGDYSLNSKETLLLQMGWALVLAVICSLFAGAAALGATVVLAVATYFFMFFPDDTARHLDSLPGVSTAMVVGLRNGVINGVVPVVAVFCLVYAIFQITFATHRRRRRREDEERALASEQLRQQREQEDAARSGVQPIDPRGGTAGPVAGAPVAAGVGAGTAAASGGSTGDDATRTFQRTDAGSAGPSGPSTTSGTAGSGDDTVVAPPRRPRQEDSDDDAVDDDYGYLYRPRGAGGHRADTPAPQPTSDRPSAGADDATQVAPSAAASSGDAAAASGTSTGPTGQSASPSASAAPAPRPAHAADTPTDAPTGAPTDAPTGTSTAGSDDVPAPGEKRPLAGDPTVTAPAGRSDDDRA